jgi:hypothetical protein
MSEANPLILTQTYHYNTFFVHKVNGLMTTLNFPTIFNAGNTRVTYLRANESKNLQCPG